MSPADLDRLTRWIRRQLEEAIAEVQGDVTMEALERALLARNVDEAIGAMRFDQLLNALARIQAELGPLRAAAWEEAAGPLRAVIKRPGMQITLGAHQLQRPDVTQAIQAADLQRIKGITAETDRAIRASITKGIRDGIHPTKLAKEIRSQIGLTEKQAAAVGKYRERLVREGRKPDQVDRMTDKYAQRQIRNRAEAIAITETSRAQNEGTRLQHERLVTEGTLQGDEWEREWVTAKDERTCPSCAPMNGQRTTIGGAFLTDRGPMPAPPIHPRCRCVVRLVPRGFRKGQSTSTARDAVLAKLRKGARA